MSLSNTTKIKGLYTFGNEITQVEGSLEIADNVNVDEPSVITPRRGFEDIGQQLPALSMRVSQLMSYKKTVIRHYNTVLEWENLNGTFSTFSGVYEQLDPTVRLKFVEANSNLLFTTKNGIMKISAKKAEDFSSNANYITTAGINKAVDITALPIYQDTGFLPPQSKVAYKVLFGKKDVNNNLQLGTPTTRFVVTNTSNDVYTYEKSYYEFKEKEQFKPHHSVLTCANVTNTLETKTAVPSYIKISNAKNKNNYVIWFDKGNGVAPVILGYIPIKVILTGIAGVDNVAPIIRDTIVAMGGLVGINVNLSGTDLIINNQFGGLSDGVQSSTGTPSTDIGGGWSIATTQSGTASKFIENYFLVSSKTKKYCFYYGNTDTIDTLPSDPTLSGSTFISILITNESSKSYIANQTAQEMINVLGSDFQIELSISGVNPYITLIDTLGGDVPDPAQGTMDSSVMEISITNQGTITKGQNANVNVSFSIPKGVDTTHFFRIYRTGYMSALELEIPLADTDPGEECFLVYEGPVNVISGQTITVLDISPDSFRQAGEPLYTNPSSGDGTSRANDIPPISKDICNYKGYTFYANTSTFQNLSIDLLSIDGFTSGVTKLVVANGSVEEYTLRGKSSRFTLVCGEKSTTAIHKVGDPSARLIMYSVKDETKYIVYFDDGTGSSPEDVDAVLIKVDISDLDPTDDVAETLRLTLSQFPDFEVTRIGNVLNIELSENGTSTPFTTPNDDIAIDLGITWILSTNEIGIGEDASTKHVLLSKSPSVSMRLERTARSIVNVILANPTSILNAYYMSGQNDIPGKIRFESKDLSSGEFYIALKAGDVTNFSPEIPSIGTTSFTDIVADGIEHSILEYVSHPFVNNEEVYIYLPTLVPSIKAKYNVEVVDVDHIRIKAQYLSGDTSNGFYFFPFIASDNLAISNRLMYSKQGIPEAVPSLNYIDIGTRDEPIERILSIRDYLFVLKTDGIFSLSGDNYLHFNVRQIDTEGIVCPDSAVVLNNQIYMLTTTSVLSINESSPSIVSRMIENKISEVIREDIDYRSIGFGVAYEEDRAYLLWLPSSKKDTGATQCYRYNILERTWTRWTKSATCGIVTGKRAHLYIGDGDRGVTMKERKSGDRTDHADRDFEIYLSTISRVPNKYKVSDTRELEIGDVVVQSQLVNIVEYNLLLKKLDIDQGLSASDFFEKYECKVTDNLASKLNSLNLRLVTEDSVSGIITYHSFDNADWVDMRIRYNQLIDELNDSLSVTVLKDYKKSTRGVNYEYVITEIDIKNSEIKVNSETEIVQGVLNVYKSIKSKVRFNPLHFGNPSSSKQINTGYLLFDQNNFYQMTLEYKSDLSASYEGTTFNGKGMGFWGNGTWGSTNSKNYWGGEGNDAPRRTIIPRNKQRCRYISPQFTHATARDYYRVVGVAHEVREVSNRAYRGLA